MPFDPKLALDLARYARDAYKAYLTDDQFLTGYKNLDGSWQQSYSRETWLQANDYQLIVDPDAVTPDARYFGIVASTADSVIVAFRGTDTFNDFVTDGFGGLVDNRGNIFYPFAFFSPHPPHKVQAHAGFVDVYAGLQASVRQTVKELFQDPAKTKLYVTGHSLGGAVATLCAVDLANAFPEMPRPRLWTFASPRVGDWYLANAVDSATLESYRIADTADWVPTVPDLGWTVDWQTWWYGGKVGPQPQKYDDFVHVGDEILVTSGNRFLGVHYLDSYYYGVQQLVAADANPKLKPKDAITSLVVRIATEDTLGAGTDGNVFISLLGAEWGPLDSPGNDFEAGSVGEYDLFKSFPKTIPPNPRVSDLKTMGLRLGDNGYFVYNTLTEEWSPAMVEITVNGIVFTTVFLNGTLSWQQRTYDCFIRMTSEGEPA